MPIINITPICVYIILFISNVVSTCILAPCADIDQNCRFLNDTSFGKTTVQTLLRIVSSRLAFKCDYYL